MKKYIYIIIFVIIAGCGKEAIKVDENFEGLWYGNNGQTDYTMEINNSGQSTFYERYGSNSSSSRTYKGKARIKKDELKIGKGEILMISLVSDNFKKVITY